MKVNVKLLDNYEEIADYNAIISEKGEEEAVMLGHVRPQQKFVKSQLLFKIDEISMVWLVEGDMINIKMDDGDLWTVYYNENLWNKLVEHFNE